jgi:hypothetical protein
VTLDRTFRNLFLTVSAPVTPTFYSLSHSLRRPFFRNIIILSTNYLIITFINDKTIINNNLWNTPRHFAIQISHGHATFVESLGMRPQNVSQPWSKQCYK